MPQYYKGRVNPPNMPQRHRDSWARYGRYLQNLPQATAPSFDWRQFGIVGPIKDQSQCGSCWDFSGTGVVEMVLFKAGILPATTAGQLSEQYTLDCGQNGGCNGDDNTTVLAWAKQTGLPLTSCYGPYQAQSGSCNNKSCQLYKITDWGYCGAQDGVCDTQAIKNAMVAYGPIGAAVAADSDFSNYQAGQVYAGDGSTSIDHDIILVGWDDSKGSKGAWILRNSWGTSWGDQGYMWIEYGANEVGYAAVWATTPAQILDWLI